MDFFILAPAKIFSGGPELAHQLCYELNRIGHTAKMYYIDYFSAEPVDIPACDEYRKYHTEHIQSINELNEKKGIIVFNESSTSYIPAINRCDKKVLWWMSVDYYRDFNDEYMMDVLDKEITLHLVQSFYAYKYVKEELKIEENKIVYLSDYIDEMYGKFVLPSQCRKDIALYNPKKGYEYIKPLIEKADWLKWIPLIHLNREQLMIVMQMAKIYVDFGNHPGKDRIPREAAINGCCVITNTKGSAAYEQDVPIDSVYKFKNVESEYNKINNFLKDICNNFDLHSEHFNLYREMIRSEKEKFQQDVINMVNQLSLL